MTLKLLLQIGIGITIFILVLSSIFLIKFFREEDEKLRIVYPIPFISFIVLVLLFAIINNFE